MLHSQCVTHRLWNEYEPKTLERGIEKKNYILARGNDKNIKALENIWNPEMKKFSKAEVSGGTW